MAHFISILGADVPVDVAGFITPQWSEVLAYYPKWYAAVDWSHHRQTLIQPYMLQFAKELEKLGRSGTVPHLRSRTADEWMKRYFEHFGVRHFMNAVEHSRSV